MSKSPTKKPTTTKRLMVYQGIRSSKASKVVALQLLAKDAVALEGQPRHYAWKRANEKTIGSIYEIEMDEDGAIYGLATAKLHGRWVAKSEVVMWEALEASALDSLATAKLEGDAKRFGEIDRAMAPLRATYRALHERHAYAECYALEHAVLRALKGKPKGWDTATGLGS